MVAPDSLISGDEDDDSEDEDDEQTKILVNQLFINLTYYDKSSIFSFREHYVIPQKFQIHY